MEKTTAASVVKADYRWSDVGNWDAFWEMSEKDDQGREVMVLFCPKGEDRHRVPVVQPSAKRVQEIQEHLAKLLFAQTDES